MDLYHRVVIAARAIREELPPSASPVATLHCGFYANSRCAVDNEVGVFSRVAKRQSDFGAMSHFPDFSRRWVGADKENKRFEIADWFDESGAGPGILSAGNKETIFCFRRRDACRMEAVFEA